MRGFLVLVLVAIAGAPLAAAQAGYRTAQSVKTDGGELRVLEDARITPDIETELWKGCVDPGTALYGDPRAKQFVGKPPVAARLQQADAKGAILADMVLEEHSPVARIKAETLGPAANPVFMVEMDNSACMGSYSGRAIRLYGFADGRISRVMAEGAGGERREVLLLSRLKSGWRFVRKAPGDIVIHAVRCDPGAMDDKGKVSFVLGYTTYRFDGSKWTWAMRQEPGFWESERDFPAAGKFP
jgi:hypothetical protein